MLRRDDVSFPSTSLLDERDDVTKLPPLLPKSDEHQRLSLSWRWCTETLSVTFDGFAESDQRTLLAQALHQVHKMALGRSAKCVELDWRALQLMSSGCFRELVSWLATSEESRHANRYQIRFVADPSRPWQQETLQALANFAPTRVARA